MDNLIQIKRGSGVTPLLADGELGYNKDAKTLSIGTGGGNVTVGRPILPVTQETYDAMSKDDDTIYIIESDDAVITESILKDKAFTGGTYNGDFNNAKLGTYWTQPSQGACSNYPDGATFGFLTTKKGGGQLVQTYTQYGNGRTWLRSYVNSEWTSWFRQDSTSSVPTSRTVNGKALSSNISLSASDVGAAPSSHSHSYLPLEGGTMSGTITTPGNDTVVIKPANNNYDQIGGSDCKFWKMYATTFYGDLSGNASSASSVAWSGVTGKPNVATIDKLWENASKGSDFGAQTINISGLSSYNFIFVTGSVSGYPGSLMSSGIIMNVTSGGGYLNTFGPDFWLHARQFTINSGSISFTSGYMKDLSNGNTYNDWNGRSIPNAIYGIKVG